MIHVREVSKSFGDVQALKRVSFEAPDGAITGLLGANGAGKTTTLRMICGVMRLGDGAIRVGGACPHADPVAARRHFGALLDHQGLYSRLTPREHFDFFGRLRGLRGPRLDRRIDDTVRALGLTTVADRPARGLSQGERIKVSLGCALIHEPAHLVLDEPTNGLDVPSVRALRTLLLELRDRGTCIVFSSHVLGEIDALCDRVVMLAHGAVVAEGTLDDVRRNAGAATLEDAFVALIDGMAVRSC
jgi:sodium transport system ATP-binding protein